MRHVAVLFGLIAASSLAAEPSRQSFTTTVPDNRPFGVPVSGYVRSIQGGSIPDRSDFKNHDILLIGRALALRSNRRFDAVILATDGEKERLKAIVLHDPRFIVGKLTSVACRRVDGRGPFVVVSGCRFAAAS